MPEETDLNDPSLQPSPEGGWSESLIQLQDAYVVPPTESNFVQATGVLTSEGAYCAQGATWRRYRPLTTEPDRPETAQPLTGRWLWGGVLWAHFGHFLTESVSRLWALDFSYDGILFVPKRPRLGEATRSFHRAFIDQLVPVMPVKVVTEPVQVEKLVVPGQGFGLGKITTGTPAFRKAFHEKFAVGVRPEGAEKIYISRSGLGLDKGGIIGEEHLEDLLRDEGYEIFFPEKHDIPTQLARYKAAKQIVAADGSALHLFALVGRSDQRVAMIKRRKSGANDLLTEHVRSFTGAEPLAIDALRTEWVRSNRRKSDRLSFGELDHAKVGAALQEAGFTQNSASWKALSQDERHAVFEAKGIAGSDAFIESPSFKKQRIREIRLERRRKRAEQQS